MSYAAAVEPLRAANQLAGKILYRWWHATPKDKPAAASNGILITPDCTLAQHPRFPDVVLVCAGSNPWTFKDRRTYAWLHRLASHGVILGGISGGPMILAQAGLLNGRRCTVHWEHIPGMREMFPDVEFAHSLFEIDNERITCSGGIAALDMMIALIRRDHGYTLSTAVSDWFLHTQVREGLGPQRMNHRHRLGVSDQKLLRAVRLMEAHLERPLPRHRLAQLVGASLRHLERLFRNQLGQGIHEYYLDLRLARSRQLLRETSLSVLEVATATGFASSSHFCRAFKRRFALPPRSVRKRDWQLYA